MTDDMQDAWQEYHDAIVRELVDEMMEKSWLVMAAMENVGLLKRRFWRGRI